MPGDYGALDVMIGTIRTLSKSGDGLRSMSKALAAEAVTQVGLGFRESRDPYGNAWKPLKYRDGKPLLDTRRLAGSISPGDITEHGFRIGTNVSYARYHQDGVDARFQQKARKDHRLYHLGGPNKGKFAKYRKPKRGDFGALAGFGVRELNFTAKEVHLVIPRRQFIPEGTLGPIWSKAFADASQIALSRILKR